MTAADLPVLAIWRGLPHVRRWWGPPDVESAADMLREARVAMWIVVDDRIPLALVQDYAVADWSPHHFDYLPSGSRGIDLYIGPAESLGRGHGVRILRQHAAALFGAGVPALGIDPHPLNARARRAFARAGFVVAEDGPRDTSWGRALLMHRYADIPGV